MADTPYAHLHVHTEYSMLDGAARLKELFKEVKANGMTHVAMTDHGNMYGAAEFHRQAKDAGITPEVAAKATFLRGKGCNHCHQGGYRGRLGIFEMMKLNAQIREMTFNREPTQTIRKVARKTGMRTLLQDGIQKSL